MVKALRMSAVALTLGLFVSPSVQAAEGDDAFFKEKVWPLIEASCVDCHGEKKQKSKLRLDSRDAWLKGGDNGVSVVAGDPAKSDVVQMIKRTYKDEDYHMPPKKSKALSEEQVKIIEDWIAKGLPWPQ